jgi:3-hydroxyisobutyrate dehydrogenase-like beta-hydroxyacid dehydrogenase
MRRYRAERPVRKRHADVHRRRRCRGCERSRPVLRGWRNIFHAGAQGAGQVAKICNNMLLAIHMTGTAEALALGVANGLDPACCRKS